MEYTILRHLNSKRSIDCFTFSDHFLRMVFPAQIEATPQVTPHVKKLIMILDGELTRKEKQHKLKLGDHMHFLKNYLQPALKEELIEMTIPEKPKSRNQKYRLTKKGMELISN